MATPERRRAPEKGTGWEGSGGRPALGGASEYMELAALLVVSGDFGILGVLDIDGKPCTVGKLGDTGLPIREE